MTKEQKIICLCALIIVMCLYAMVMLIQFCAIILINMVVCNNHDYVLMYNYHDFTLLCNDHCHLLVRIYYDYMLVCNWAVQWSWSARVNALCHLSCMKLWDVTASLLGQFLSRNCFTLCITMEVEPITAKQYKCHNCCSCKITGEWGWRVGKKCLHHFLADQKIASSS